jgi:hypothetical protein
MALHLPGKISRLISDFLTIERLADLIEHELEKRVVARHGLVKLDSLLELLARLKNEMRQALPANQRGRVADLERMIARLRKDYTGSDMEAGRDAMAAHALQLSLERIVTTWRSMGAATFGVLASDLREIDAELSRVCPAYPAASEWPLEPSWPDLWKAEGVLGDPTRPRLANVYPGLATAGVVAPVPGGHPAQDATIRAAGVATFLRQVRLVSDVSPPGGNMERLFAEMMVNDFFSLWELLFTSGVRNEHGQPDLSILEHWKADAWAGANCLAALSGRAHPDLELWRTEVRNKHTAHTDASVEIWRGDLSHWPMSFADVINEARRVIEALRECARLDIRSKIFFVPPTYLGGQEVIGLAAQEGRYWKDG